MDLAQRIEHTREVCFQEIESADLASCRNAFRDAGLTPATMYGLLRAGAERKKPAADLLALRSRLATTASTGADFERAVLLYAAPVTLDGLASLRTEESVKHLICKELMEYARPRTAMLPRFALESRSFAAMSGIVSLTRFPAGQYQWVVSGLPRRWLARVPPNKLASLLRFLALDTKGFRPMFMPHLGGGTAPPGFVTSQQYYKSFYRMVASMERQPEIKGILAASWMHSRETHRVSPHLAFYNHPYMEVGGLYIDLGAAKPDEGFLTGDPQRVQLYRDGSYRPTQALVLCSREQAISWARTHRDLEAKLPVR